MSIKVVEAIGDKDNRTGDSSGNEILIREFKRRSYSFSSCLRCKDRSMAERAVGYAKRIAECRQFGYSQSNRWDGAKQIERVGVDSLELAGAGDFDCSSLVLSCYRFAGLPLRMTGYTGNMVDILLKTNKFYEANEVLTDMEYARVGDVLVAPGIHALLIITDGMKSEQDDDSEIPPVSHYVLIKGNNVRIRTGAGKTYPTVRIAHKGETYPYCETDADTGWYWIYTDAGIWCITGKPRYTELI